MINFSQTEKCLIVKHSKHLSIIKHSQKSISYFKNIYLFHGIFSQFMDKVAKVLFTLVNSQQVELNSLKNDPKEESDMFLFE